MDINNDGNPDIISGSWPGEIFLFRGTEDHSFSAPEMIKDKDGEFINIGGRIRKDTMFNPWGKNQPEGLLIAGYAKFERTPEGPGAVQSTVREIVRNRPETDKGTNRTA